MTEKEKKKIETMRRNGMTCKEISKKLDLSVGCIKTYCSRHGIAPGEEAAQRPAEKGEGLCEYCRRPVEQKMGRKHKRFCSDRCRNLWWNSHMEQVKKKAVYDYTCPCCGIRFQVYGNSHRKYCSRDCYFKDRYEGGKH